MHLKSLRCMEQYNLIQCWTNAFEATSQKQRFIGMEVMQLKKQTHMQLLGRILFQNKSHRMHKPSLQSP